MSELTPEMQADLHSQLGAINATLTRIEASLSAHVISTDKRFHHTNDRMRQTESKLNYGAGALAVLGAIGAAIFGGFYR